MLGEERLAVPVVDARADACLKRMSEYLGGLKQFSFVAEAIFDELDDTTGQKLQFSKVSRVDVARPDRLRGTTEGDLANRKYCYDGKQLTVMQVGRDVYSAVKVPPSIDEMFDFVAEQYGIVVPLSDLLLKDVYGALKTDVQIGQYVGLHRVGKLRCHHLAFTQQDVDWQIWIEDGDKPLPRKLVITYKLVPEAPQYCATFVEWTTSQNFPSDHFRFEPPANAHQVEMRPVDRGPQANLTDPDQ